MDMLGHHDTPWFRIRTHPLLSTKFGKIRSLVDNYNLFRQISEFVSVYCNEFERDARAQMRTRISGDGLECLSGVQAIQAHRTWSE